MAKNTVWKCADCHTQFPKWQGQCSSCKAWNTVEEIAAEFTVATSRSTAKAPSVRSMKAATGAKASPLSHIIKAEEAPRTLTDISELDRVLGGGLVLGSVILLAAAPGSGKSSLLGAVSQTVAVQGKTVLYVSGEENETQIASRHNRINSTSENILILSESNLQNILEQAQSLKPDLIIIDSVQTIVSEASESKIGSPSQVIEVANDITQLAKRLNIPTFLIGHVTKAQEVSGPQTLAHLVDVVLYLESSSDSPLRILRADKNRFGDSTEIGIFQHTETGLEEVADPSGFFTNTHEAGTSGYANTIIVEGNRAMPAEVQALITVSPLPNPRKISHGLDHPRGLMIQAILEKNGNLKIGDKDVYLSTTNGLTIKDSSVDLGIAAALTSSFLNTSPPDNSVFIGELSLTGEIRKARFAERRKKEAERLGFSAIYDHENLRNVGDLVRVLRDHKNN